MNDQFHCHVCTTEYMAEPELLGNRVRCKKCGSVVEIPELRNTANEKNQQMTEMLRMTGMAGELKTIREELDEFKNDIENLNKLLSAPRSNSTHQKKETHAVEKVMDPPRGEKE
jgi:hypothetical protein